LILKIQLLNCVVFQDKLQSNCSAEMQLQIQI